MTSSSSVVTEPPAKPRRGSVKQRVLESAVTLFAERGYDATSVSDIVEHAGVTKGAMYHYFTAKEDLLLEIYRPLLNEQITNLDTIMAANLTATERIRRISQSTIETTASRAREVAVFSRDSTRLGAAGLEELQHQWQRYQDTVRGVIREGQASGEFSNIASPLVISWALFSISNSIPSWFNPEGAKSATEIAEEFSSFILAGLKKEETP